MNNETFWLQKDVINNLKGLKNFTFFGHSVNTSYLNNILHTFKLLANLEHLEINIHHDNFEKDQIV